MSRHFITQVISRALHDEDFRALLQRDAESAANAMELEYSPEDLRAVEALHSSIDDLDSDAAREYLQGITQQEQDIFGGPQRPTL